MTQIALLGAFDRFNYGDLLFPIIAGNEIAAHSQNCRTLVHALISSDLSQFGALPTRPLSELHQSGKLRDGDVVLFAGGGTVGVDWTYMFANLLGPFGNRMLSLASRMVGEAQVNALSRMRFGAQSPYPWVAGPEDFPARVKIAYNAIGGSELVGLPQPVQRGTLERLSRATYLSVRDAETKRVFAVVQDSIEVHVAPDSAVLMSEQFPLTLLRKRSSPAAIATVDESPYICFQANQGYLNRNLDLIASALEQVYESHGLAAVLLPIGRYVGLDDHLGLATLRKRLRTPVRLASDQASLWEIMMTIAQSRLFLGTSLHGAVTSQSFAVPHLGLSHRPGKLDHYLGTWDLPEQSECVSLSHVPDRVSAALAVQDAVRRGKRAELVGLARANMARLASACVLSWG